MIIGSNCANAAMGDSMSNGTGGEQGALSVLLQVFNRRLCSGGIYGTM